MTKATDFTGEKIGRLTGQYRHPENTSRGKPRWVCLCECGAETIISSDNLSSGSIKSCGCLRRDRMVDLNTTHGGAGTPEHSAWEMMKKRCYLESNCSYKDYGGRGITVCDRWRNSFENFLADMGLRPSNDHSIERDNNDGNYEPNNCRRATRLEQSNNKRTNVFYEYQGRQMTLAEISRETGIGYSTLFERVRSSGLTAQQAAEKGNRK